MSIFHELEKRIDEKLRGLFRSAAPQAREIVEVQRYILDQIGERVQTLPRARRVFPFNDVVIRIPVADADRRAALEMVFLADGALAHDVREYLRREAVEAPTDLQILTTLYDTTEVLEPSLVCHNREKSEEKIALSKKAAEPPTVRFTVLSSGAVVEMAKARIHLGRLAEVLDDRLRPVRRNDVIVDEATVSRAHAHLDWDAATEEYRLYDDGSTYGTGLVHEGKFLNVPAGASRGIRIQPGDEVYLGQSRLLVEAV